MSIILDLIRTGLFWVIFALGLFLSTLFEPWLKARTRASLRIFIDLMFKVRGIEVRLVDGSKLPAERGMLIAVNHQSFLDNLVLIARFPLDFRFVAADAGFKLPFIGKLYRRLGYIQTHLLMNLAESGQFYRALKSRENIIIYGKGKDLPRFSEALVRSAELSSLPVVPVYLQGSSQIMPFGSFWPRPGRVEVRFGQPVRPRTPAELSQEFEKLMQVI